MSFLGCIFKYSLIYSQHQYDLPAPEAAVIYTIVLSLAALGKTSRRWANLTEDPQLWRYLLIRDFGQEYAVDVSDKDCKQKYIQMYECAQEFIKETKTIPATQALLDASKVDQSVKLCGLISNKGFEEYLGKLSVKQLELVFFMALGRGLTPIMKLIMQSSRFKEIPTEALQRAFVLATERDLFVAEDLIKQSSRFSEISN